MLISTSYPNSATDWRGRFIASMVEVLAQSDELKLTVWAPSGNLPTSVHNACTRQDAVFLDDLSNSGGIAHAIRSRGPLTLVTISRLLSHLRNLYRRSNYDILHINWLQNALPLPKSRTPCLITVLGSDFGLLKLPGMTTLLRHAIRGRTVLLAPNAEWMCAELDRRFGDMARVRAIPFGVDDHWFNIKRYTDLRAPYQWLAVTRLTKAKLGKLFEWGELIFRGNHELHLFGPKQEADIQIPDWVRYHGPTHPLVLRSEWFPQAAGLITLSEHNEGRPQVMLEAMAAGLPVIASILPAHNDLIKHQETGLLVNSENDFTDAIEFLSNPANNLAMGAAGKDWIIANVGTWHDCAERYISAYRELVEAQV